MLADDTNIYLRGKNLVSMTYLLQDFLNSLNIKVVSLLRIYLRSRENQMHFVFKKKRIPKPEFCLGNTPLLFVNSIKILGLIFDNKLT